MSQRIAIGRIRRLLFNRNVTCAEIDRKYKLYKNQASDALYQPNEAGENAIARELNKPASNLWPHRFDENGNRFSPQPRSNYRTRKTDCQRQNCEVA